jgi:hypothetical protein
MYDRYLMSLLAPDEVPGKDFDRIHYRPSCHKTGRIEAVWVSLTKIVLEGRCDGCGKISIHHVDLLQVDAWLNGKAESPLAADPLS